MDDIRTELLLSGSITLNDAAVRNLAGKPSGSIAMSDCYGKTGPTIKSIQRGSVELEARTNTNITISSVNMAKTILYTECVPGYIGYSQSNSAGNFIHIGAELSSSTNIYAVCGGGQGQSYLISSTLYWTIVEYL